MKQHVTIVPSDRLIMVNGAALRFAFSAPANLHALQWHEGKGHRELTDAPNQSLCGEAQYAGEVAPYVALWEAEKARLEAEAAAAEAARLAEHNSPEARAQRLRAERDVRMASTDYRMAADYPLDEAQRALWAAYRQALRDLPQQEGFPWDGGGEATPWPALPGSADAPTDAGETGAAAPASAGGPAAAHAQGNLLCA